MALPLEEVWVNRSVVKIILKSIKDKPGVAAQLFEILANEGVNAELIVQGPSSKGRTDLAFLILESQLPKILEKQEEILEMVDGRDISVDKKVALLVFYGGKELSKRPGVAARVFDILAQAGVNIEMISTSLESLSIVIRENRVDDAIIALRDNLGIEPEGSYQR